jgi:hypothetical protein
LNQLMLLLELLCGEWMGIYFTCSVFTDFEVRDSGFRPKGASLARAAPGFKANAVWTS